MENSKFGLFQKHKLDNLHAVIGGSIATIGAGRMANCKDVFYLETETKTKDATWVTRFATYKGDFVMETASGEQPDPDTYGTDWWAEEIPS